MVNILYPRTVSVRRQLPPASAPGGAQVFGGSQPVAETVILSNICASISYDRVGRGDPAGLPTDPRRANVMIILPLSAASQGQVQTDDIIVDDQGTRYQVYYADWQIVGYTLHTELLIA